MNKEDDAKYLESGVDSKLIWRVETTAWKLKLEEEEAKNEDWRRYSLVATSKKSTVSPEIGKEAGNLKTSIFDSSRTVNNRMWNLYGLKAR